jgi:predicted metal-dependent hydrolase
MQPSRHQIEYGRETIAFTLAFHRSRRLSITVHPDKRVEVRAPEGEAPEEVLGRVRRRAAWILRQLDRFDRFHPLPAPRRHVSGETHLYLGRQYRLKVQPATAGEAVKQQGKYIHIFTADQEDAERIRDLLNGWYRNHARRVFARRLEACHAAVAGLLAIPRPAFQLRRMATRWGSCTRAGNVLLNPELVKTPLACIDYVLIHELCHLKVLNHGPEFRVLLARCLPDWRRWKVRV